MLKKTGLFTCVIIFFLVLYGVNPCGAAPEPEITGEAAVILDSKNGQVLYEKNLHQRMYPASTTKTLTAVLALENGKLDDRVTVPGEACRVEGSAIGLQEGEQISLEYLIYSLMLISGNDAAVAIASHVGGSVENFVNLMNQKAAEIGAVNTHFSNPNGLSDPEHYSTAYDLALITRYAMQNPVFRKIVSTKVQTIERQNSDAQIYLENLNKMLWQYEGAIGVKTGYTSLAGQCLVSAAVREDRELIAVVMKSQWGSIWNDTQLLLDYGFHHFKKIKLTEAGTFITNVPVRYGVLETVPGQTGSTLSYNLSGDKQAVVSREIILMEDITAPVMAGEKVGELAFFTGGTELGRVDLVAQQEVGKRLSAQWWPWFLLLLGLFVIAGIVCYHNNARRKRWERYRRKYTL